MKLFLLFVILITTAEAVRASMEYQQVAQRGEPKSARPPAPRGLIDTQVQSAAQEPGDTFRDCADCTELVVVPAGQFVMGSNDTPYEKPERTISIPAPFA